MLIGLIKERPQNFKQIKNKRKNEKLLEDYRVDDIQKKLLLIWVNLEI
jgi:hypothetical protein